MNPGRVTIRFLLLLCLVGCSLAGGPESVPSPRSSEPTPGSRSDAEKRRAGGDGDRSMEGSQRGALGTNGGSGVGAGVSGDELALSVVETALEAIGTPYRWGGTGANGFDCSGLIRYAYGLYGIDLPRISRDQLEVGTPLNLAMDSLRPGDILGFSAVVGGEATHVGLYVGGGDFIHSSTSGVRISDLREPYWQRHFMAARRVV